MQHKLVPEAVKDLVQRVHTKVRLILLTVE